MQEVFGRLKEVRGPAGLGASYKAAVASFEEMRVRDIQTYDGLENILNALRIASDSFMVAAGKVAKKAEGQDPEAEDKARAKATRFTTLSQNYLKAAANVIKMKLGVLTDKAVCQQTNKIVLVHLMVKLHKVAWYYKYCEIFKIDPKSAEVQKTLQRESMKLKGSIKKGPKHDERVALADKVHTFLNESSADGAGPADEVPEGFGEDGFGSDGEGFGFDGSDDEEAAGFEGLSLT